MRFAAIIVAGGRGERAGSEVPKQYKRLAGKPVIAWSVSALRSAGATEIVIACAAEHAELCGDATAGEGKVRGQGAANAAGADDDDAGVLGQ